ncbi:MAG: hypothetical protein ACLFUH_05400 [Bacteroidales bacterium]
MKTQELIHALSVVKPGLGDKEVIDQTTAFIFADDRVVAYNDEIFISHPITSTGIEGAVKAEELYEFLNKVKKDEIEMSVEEDQLFLKAGRSKVWMKLQTEVSIPDPINEQWIDLPKGFMNILKFVSIACSKNAATPALTCIHLREDGVAEATDRYRICQQEIDFEQELLLPIDIIQTVAQIEPTMISIKDDWIYFTNEEDTIITCRKFTAEFPDIDEIIEKVSEKEFVEIKFPKTFNEIIERAIIFSKKDYVYDEHLEVHLEKNLITIKSESDYAKFEESTKAIYKGEETKFHIIPKIFQDVVQNADAIYLNDRMIKFEGTDWAYFGSVTKL